MDFSSREIKSVDYRDYVIKDGRLIGEFEQMYKNSRDIPWHQDTQTDWLDVQSSIMLLKQYGLFGDVFEPLKTIWYEDKLSDGNDNWFVAVMERK